MRYLSICSGIEAATMAWHPLGWTPAAFAEIDRFPSAVLAHHYPHVPNLGDFARIGADAVGPVDLLVGGTPCQSFSVAGLRAGLADERGNLALEYLRLADRVRPRWLVWENVPGVLSSNGGRDFGSILGGMVELGYGFAYRVLDAQYIRVDGFGRAVPQRRRRVFVVGCLGDWRRAAAVLFERSCLRGDPPPRRQAGEGIAHSVTTRAGNGSRPVGGNDTTGPIDVATARNAHGGPHGRLDFESETFVAHALRADGFDASEDGTGRGTPIVPVCDGGATEFLPQSSRVYLPDGVAPALQSAGTRMGNRAPQVAAPVCFDETPITSATNRCQPAPGDPSHPLAAGTRPPTIAFHARQDPDHGPVTHPLDTDGSSIGIFTGWRVRRLTPRECERLQNFPDDFTAIPYRGKPAADGNRYKALGNSMAVNVMCWIGRRIASVEEITTTEAA